MVPYQGILSIYKKINSNVYIQLNRKFYKIVEFNKDYEIVHFIHVLFTTALSSRWACKVVSLVIGCFCYLVNLQLFLLVLVSLFSLPLQLSWVDFSSYLYSINNKKLSHRSGSQNMIIICKEKMTNCYSNLRLCGRQRFRYRSWVKRKLLDGEP